MQRLIRVYFVCSGKYVETLMLNKPLIIRTHDLVISASMRHKHFNNYFKAKHIMYTGSGVRVIKASAFNNELLLGFKSHYRRNL